MRFDYSIHPFKIARLLGLIAVCLALISLAGEYVLTGKALDENGVPARVIDLFSVNLEDSIPTWYSTINLLISAALLAVIATVKRKDKDRFALYWIGLALIFLYLSIDEGASIHEIFSDMMETVIPPTGIFTFGWVVVGAPVALIVGLLYLRFVLNLPPRIRNLFFLAGGLYIGGALVIEAISASQYDDTVSFTYLAIATLEELCEMLGIVTLIYTLLSYIGIMQLEIALHPPASAEPYPLESRPAAPRLRAEHAIALVTGFGFALSLWLIFSEFSLAGWSSELALALIAVACVVGILYAARFPQVPVALVALSLPFWMRLLIVLFDTVNLPVVVVLPFAAALITSALTVRDARRCWPLFIPGFIAGLALVSFNPGLVMVYGLVAVLFMLTPPFAPLKLALVAAWVIGFAVIDQPSRTMVLAQLGDLPAGTTTLYQTPLMDVLQTPDQQIYLYANGHKTSGSLNGADEVITALTADVENALVIGSGLMETKRALKIADMTTVDVNPVTGAIKLLHLGDQNLIVDQVEGFLETNSQNFHLVMVETPSQLDVQTVKLYAVPFYQAIETRLASGGFIVTGLITPFKPDERISRQIAAALLATFSEVMVITPPDLSWSLAVAADDLPFDRQSLSDLLHNSGVTEFILFDTPAVKAVVGEN